MKISKPWILGGLAIALLVGGLLYKTQKFGGIAIGGGGTPVVLFWKLEGTVLSPTDPSWTVSSTSSGTTSTAVNLPSGGNITVNGQNPKKTLSLSAAGCNIPGFANGASTSSLAYFGEQVYRSVPFQPLTWGGCELDWLPPDSWDGSTIDCKFDFYATTTDANGVTWGVQAQGMGSGAALSTSFSAATATVTTVATTTNALTVTTSTSLTVGGQTVDPDMVKIRVTRSNVGASTNTASFLGAKCEYGVAQFSD